MKYETKKHIESIHINCIEREDDLKIENEQLKTQNNELRVKMNENGAVALQLKSDKVKLKEIVESIIFVACKLCTKNRDLACEMCKYKDYKQQIEAI